MSVRLDLIIDEPLDGPTNMAIDDVLFDEAGEDGRATLRFYRWREPTISLGYFQKFTDEKLSDPRISAMPLVRRVTGGGAILHADEFTYSISLPIDHPLAGGSPQDLYLWMHDRIIDAVQILGGQTVYKGGNESTSPRSGPFMCFARHASFDLVDSETGTLKFVGSAQRRTRRAIVQHGSVILRRSHEIQPSTALDALLGRSVNFEEFSDALILAVQQADVELALPARLSETAGENFTKALEKHTSDEWLKLR